MSDREQTTALRAALTALLAMAEQCEVQIDHEWGFCRTLEQIEADGDMSPEIIAAREVLKHG